MKFCPFREETARHGIQKHTLVMRHPVTGRKSSGTAYGAEGLETGEGRALIYAPREHVTRSEFTTSYKIEAGDIFLWGNFQTLHSGTGIEYLDEDGKRRLLYRIGTNGLPDLCRPMAAIKVPASKLMRNKLDLGGGAWLRRCRGRP